MRDAHSAHSSKVIGLKLHRPPQGGEGTGVDKCPRVRHGGVDGGEEDGGEKDGGDELMMVDWASASELLAVGVIEPRLDEVMGVGQSRSTRFLTNARRGLVSWDGVTVSLGRFCSRDGGIGSSELSSLASSQSRASARS